VGLSAQKEVVRSQTLRTLASRAFDLQAPDARLDDAEAFPSLGTAETDQRCAARRVPGMRTVAETMKFAAIVADSSNSRNQCPTKAPLSAKKIGIGIAYFQLPRKRLLSSSSGEGPLESLIWLHAISIAPTNATKKHAENRNGEIGIAFREITLATNAAQNGDKFRIAAMMSG
jgi:hypothetical protein